MDRPDNTLTTPPTQKELRGIRKVAQVLGKGVLPLVVLGLGACTTWYLLASRPQAKRLPRKKNPPMVETVKGSVGNHATVITAMGTVQPSRKITLSPQVSGSVIALDKCFLPGGHFTSGDILLQLDPRDYQLRLLQQKNAVAQAKNDLEIEQGKQMVAARELELMGEQVTESEKRLMLRKPQLSTLKTKLEIARAKYEQAQLDLERTTLIAPFNGVVQSRNVNLGSWVSNSTTVATLIGTDSFWVEASVAENQLKWINVPQKEGDQGSLVKIYNPSFWGQGVYREGKVIQLLPTLETQGRMARLLIEVEDPMGFKSGNENQPQLLIDSFVRAIIAGKLVENAIKISREYLHNGNTVWVYEPDGTLGIHEVDVIFREKSSVLIQGNVDANSAFIVSNLSTPIAGMQLFRQGEQKKQDKVARIAAGQDGKGDGKGLDKKKGDS